MSARRLRCGPRNPRLSMPEAHPSAFTIPSHRSFADSLVAGLSARYGKEALSLASGSILLPNNRAVRAVTEAFVRASGGGLILPRLIAVGDPELDDRLGGALDPADTAEPIPPAIEPLARELALAGIVRGQGESAAEALRVAADLARTLDALAIEERSEEHTSELQSPCNLVCRLLLEKKKSIRES